MKKTGNPLTITERDFYMSKKKKTDLLKQAGAGRKLKYEIAEELGLLDKVLEDGWKALSSKETGRIGGLITRKGERWRKQKSSDQSVNNFEPDLKREGRFVIIVKLGETTGEVMNEKIKVLRRVN